MSPADLDLLIVEDEPGTRYLLSQIFIMRGFSVRTASDGFAALQMIRSSIPDILLSDLNMPGMSGFELLSVVRRLYPQIHVIATSGAYSGNKIPKGIAADAFHEKATGLPDLFELMELAALLGHTSFYSERGPSPLWIDLESRMPFESYHVLLNCPACLRPFRQIIETVDGEIRETSCRFCGTRVEYAIALAVKPSASDINTASATEPSPGKIEPLAATGDYPLHPRSAPAA
jgi:CheY-like chemotaxis protein